ncbi:DUF3997 domain-containing protein [Limnovirga soli]|uniref:DUF3997 domain-containing protein n=1 Tax=Limnovirga soli TaxID=2656915 RepID=A0A8J8JT51_9BACT|nr:DUF3997 domain-containing protein [Limnovirga soli]NNV57692.1 DUF3997 domain-containing protein [Limnovirga soli]
MMRKMLCLIVLAAWVGSCQSDTYEEISGEYYFYEEGVHQNVIEKDGLDYYGKLIPCEILSYDYNKEYIIAAQKPVLPCFEGEFAATIHYPPNKDSIYYWIISHEQNLLVGPLTKEEFELKRMELKVPKNLKISLP